MNTFGYEKKNLTCRIASRVRFNTTLANNTWQGWKQYFEWNCGITVIDDDSGFNDYEVLTFAKAVVGLEVSILKFENSWQKLKGTG